MTAETVETPEYARMVRRVIRAYSRRVADGDEIDLRTMLEARDDLDQAITEAVAGLRSRGYSWAYIGRAAGITRQAAWSRWAR